MKQNNDTDALVAPDLGGMPQMTIGHVSIDMADITKAEPDYENLLLLPTRNLVLFPGVNLSVSLGRELTQKIARYAESKHIPLGIVCQRDPNQEAPGAGDLFGYGVVADVLKVLELPDSDHAALLHGRNSFHIDSVRPAPEIPGALLATVTPRDESVPRDGNLPFSVTVENIVRVADSILKQVFEHGAPFKAADCGGPVEIVNTVATNMPLAAADKAEMLATPRIRQRALLLLKALERYKERLDVNAEIVQRAREGMDRMQRNTFLQQQMEAIREELYGDEQNDVEEFERKLEAHDMPDKTRETIRKEIDKLRRLNPQSPDYSIQYSYLDAVLGLPWGNRTREVKALQHTEAILDDDHYGLKKVKERIVEQLALMIDNPDGKSPILCLVGPPGVGKTSLGASIARSLGRNYTRVALGGLHDEAEIRGHRRTYLGAMPGRIIDGMKRAGSANPVMLLDEIDKIGADYKGDPSAALLEVLDPEQNCHFHDNYIDVDYDLSNVLFIATANSLQNVSKPLLDRIEIIELPGYLVEEKIEIAKRHLLPNLLRNQGWKSRQLIITDDALRAIIEDYTGESGVRQLEKQLAAILRKAVVARQRGKRFNRTVTRERLKDLLGMAPFRKDRCPSHATAGVITGLAWTQGGGEILLAEVSLSPSRQGGKLTLTGNLGDVMKESAQIALEWVHSHCDELGIAPEKFDTTGVHVHFPEGAIPKDGPSAGITITTAIVSAFTGRLPKLNVAMTGEMTLRGDVLPVGGIREKILAAKRAGATDIILSEDNRRDIEDIDTAYIEGLDIHYVTTAREVIDLALEAE